MPLQFFHGKGTQPHRFRVTGDNNEPVAQSEGYTDRALAVHGAAVTLEQLLRHHPDAPTIVSEWLAELGNTDVPLTIPNETLVVAGADLTPDQQESLHDLFAAWSKATGAPITTR